MLVIGQGDPTNINPPTAEQGAIGLAVYIQVLAGIGSKWHCFATDPHTTPNASVEFTLLFHDDSSGGFNVSWRFFFRPDGATNQVLCTGRWGTIRHEDYADPATAGAIATKIQERLDRACMDAAQTCSRDLGAYRRFVSILTALTTSAPDGPAT